MKGPNWIEQRGGRRPGACLKEKSLPTSPTPVCILCGDLTGKLFHPWNLVLLMMSKPLEIREMTCTLTWVETLNGPWVCVNGVCVGPVCPGCLLDLFQVAIQVYFLSCFPVLPAEFRQIRGRRRLFVHFRAFAMCEKGKIKEKILQPADGESPSAPIGLLLERKWGGGRGGGGLGLRGWKTVKTCQRVIAW